MKKVTLERFPDVKISVSFNDPTELIRKLIGSLTLDQKDDLFDYLEELFHEDFAKRVIESPDFFFGETFDNAALEAGISTFYLTNKDSRKIISKIIDFVDPGNYTDQSIAKTNFDKINKFLKTLE